jgi:nuclear transport factor 2 (NTF2) superfamily protein
MGADVTNEGNVERVRHWEWTWNNDVVMRMVDECYAEDCEVIDVIRDRVISGREGLRAIERQMMEVDPTRRMVINKFVADGDTVVVEVESFWKDDSVVARGCVVLTFDSNGLIVSDHTYSADPVGAAD